MHTPSGETTALSPQEVKICLCMCVSICVCTCVLAQWCVKGGDRGDISPRCTPAPALRLHHMEPITPAYERSTPAKHAYGALVCTHTKTHTFDIITVTV